MTEPMRISRRFRISSVIVLLLAGAVQVLWTWSGGEVHGERVLVTRVYDGDTVVVGRGWRKTTVRLIGVDTPETVHPEKPVQFYGPEASAFTKRSLGGTWVGLEFDSPDRPGGPIDKYGRTLAYIITADGKNFNLELVRLGYGRAYTRFPFKYQKEFKAAEQKARAQGLGVWSRHTSEELADPDARGRIIGNIRSHIYHLPGQPGYTRTAKRNRVYFETEEDARKAGYRKAKN